MRLLYLVEEDQGVWPPANGLGQGASVAVANVARGGPDELGHGVLLHVLAHVHPDHRLLGAEELAGESLAELGLPHTRRTAEHEACNGPGRIAETSPCSPKGSRDAAHGLLLTDNALVQLLLEVKQTRGLGRADLLNRNACPASHYLSHILLGDELIHRGRGLLQASHGLGLPGLQRVSLVEALCCHCLLDLGLQGCQFLYDSLVSCAHATGGVLEDI
mmetsp:Transcript_12116/g.26900  ORF Transcript_12116/g.26900 Transcript_12116/m.26900 type:complete len:218 (+) Transcript_12116:803-1456(+)